MALTVSYLNTPQAVDDTFTISAADLTVKQFDVMANDSGGKAKTLYSLDGGEVSSDLLVRDTTKGSEFSAKGATIWMTTDGKLAYDASALADQLGRLNQGEIFEDSFSYAIQLGNGTLSVATAIVKIIGVNDAPTAAPDTNAAVEDGPVVTGSVATNDGDVDNGAVLKYALSGEIAGLTLNEDGSYTFDASNSAYQDLAAGQTVDVEAAYTVTDEFGASAGSSLKITVTGTSDELPSVAVDDTVVTNIKAGNPILIPDSALLANDVGDDLAIAGVTGSEATLTDSGDVVFTDQGSAGGSFEYALESGSATVTVEVQEGRTIAGTAGGEILIGGTGNDVLYGESGDDLLIGGLGLDQMTGGAGADIFIYRAGDIDLQGGDLVWDFNPTEGDRLDLRDLLSSWGMQDASELGMFVQFVPTVNGNSQMNVNAPGDTMEFFSGAGFMGIDLSTLNPADFVILS